MMSLPVWLPGPIVPLGVSVPGHMFLPGGGGISVMEPPHPQHTHRHRPLYGEERVVRIILECFLVVDLFLQGQGRIHDHFHCKKT